MKGKVSESVYAPLYFTQASAARGGLVHALNRAFSDADGDFLRLRALAAGVAAGVAAGILLEIPGAGYRLWPVILGLAIIISAAIANGIAHVDARRIARRELSGTAPSEEYEPAAPPKEETPKKKKEASLTGSFSTGGSGGGMMNRATPKLAVKPPTIRPK